MRAIFPHFLLSIFQTPFSANCSSSPSTSKMDAPQQQQQSPNRFMDEENNPVMEGIPELTLNIHVDELMVLCEIIVDFKNLKDNGFEFSETLEFQGWKGFFERLIGLVYPVLANQFWIHVVSTKDTITSLFMNRKIVVT